MSEILEKINSPKDLRKLDMNSLIKLCDEIRYDLIHTVSHTGGHLASGLGVVELTVAIHSVFDTPKDTLIFDVGHQCYAHKLLTGRRESFEKLRKKDGISGFPKPCESEYDSFICGHASTSISLSVGLSKAKELSGDNSKVIALIGDGAFTGGMVYEALNNLEKEMTNLIVILNDNSMSISKNVGTVASYLLRLRTNKNYGNLKKSVQTVLDKTPVVGPWMKDTILKSKSIFRRSIYGGTFFEELGFNYVGPVDGHNLPELCQLLENVRDMQGPILVHTITTKGKGFALAEKNPGAYHGVGSFDLELGNPDISEADSFSNVFGHELCAIADTDSRVCAVTAAMKYGTGLQYFYKKHKQRFFDVGIAEEHAVTFCAGLSRGGKKPVFAVYSSFMQRCVDQLIHDISLSGMDFLLAVDRSGLVGEDGETHQGVFDAAILSEIRALTVVSPSNYSELRYWTRLLVDYKGPAAIRYPRGHEDEAIVDYISTGNAYDIITENKASKALFVTYGREFADVVRAAKLLSDMKIKTDILKLNVISPIDMNAVELARGYSVVFFAEEGVKNGGINEHFLRLLCFAGFKGKYVVCAIDNPIIAQASICEQKKAIGLDCDSLAKKMKEEL